MKKDFSFIAEVPASVNEASEELVKKAGKLLELGFTAVSFSDRARADSNVLTIQDLLNANIFPKINSDNLLPILATRTKHPEEIDQIVASLKKQNVKNLFVVTGDPHKNSRSNFLTSLDIILGLSKSFNIGAAAHADVVSLDRDVKKIDAGAKFLIVQACYDINKWITWTQKAIEMNLHKKARILQTVIPLINKTILENMHSLHDVNLPEDLYSELSTYSEEDLKKYGINAAIAQIEEIKKSDFFSGVYIYSRDFDTMSQISSATLSTS